MMMPPQAPFSGAGFICCAGISATEGEVFRLLDPESGSRIADLVATGAEAASLRFVSDRRVRTTVAGIVISPPGALRPRVRVTSVSAPPAQMMNPMINLDAAFPRMPPPTERPALTPAEVSYLDCVANCIATKVPGLAAEEIFNSICANTLLAMGELQGVVGLMRLASVPRIITLLAGCVALTAGISTGAVIECFLACLPGGRLRQGPIELDDDDDDDDNDNDNDNGNSEFQFVQNGTPAVNPSQLQLPPVMQMAAAIVRNAAARGVQLTPAQVLQLLRQCPQAVAPYLLAVHRPQR